MGQSSKPRAVAARPWLLLVCLAQAAIAGVIHARADLSTDGFISIDCGFTGTTNYVDEATTLSFLSDAGYTDAGESRNISDKYITNPKLPRYFHNLRSFPNGTRNCYTFLYLKAGNKYLLRASFMYGNYDGKNMLPRFDLYVGVHYWTNVSVPDDTKLIRLTVFVVVPNDFVDVCLVNTGSGTPFISVLSLRPLKSLYPQVTATQGLVLQARYRFDQQRTDDNNPVLRWPDDPLDRLWFSFKDTDWDLMSTNMTVTKIEDDPFDTPKKVMQTAVTPRTGAVASKSIKFPWDTTPPPQSPGYFFVMYFAELQKLNSSSKRELSISITNESDDGGLQNDFQPRFLQVISSYNHRAIGGNSTRLDVSIDATAESTLPPFINAIEIYSAISTPNTGTNSQDVSAMKVIKKNYRVLTKNWMGDPCVDKAWKWDGLTCSYPTSGSPTITGVNMSFSGLNGEISSTFANLQSVQFLDLSHNNLTGSIPDALSQLSSLTVLDLTGNQLSGSIPRGLLEKIQDGSLSLTYADNPNLCTASDICQLEKGKSRLAIFITVPMALALPVVVGLLFCFLRLKRRGSINNPMMPRNETMKGHAPTGDGHGHTSLRLENRRFTYKDLKRVTNNFQRVIGRGGFGYVYDGFLEDGTQVAVKVRSQSSNQGVKEFLTEAQILTRVHHKNLVSMIGYCKDGGYMALVYEYMSQGTLQEHIAGKHLTWRQRLRIALESAVGLEYLHKGCNPPLIHRDVKTTNILLNAKLEAKVADFGLSRTFNRDISTHVSTNTLVGTPGYVDPEYQATMQPTTKSDVYGFGVVLLQLVTGNLPIMHSPHPTSLIQWTRQQLARGDIDGVLDVCMRGNYDVNSVWKATEVALQCTEQASAHRPTMTDVVAQLQECLSLEEGRAGGEVVTESFYSGGSSGPSLGYNAHVLADQSADVSLSSTFEMEHFGMVAMMDAGPAIR